MRSNRTPWFNDARVRFRFESGARASYPSLRSPVRHHAPGADIVYRVTIDIPDYETRRVGIHFFNGMTIDADPKITCDGPKLSPHRYKGGMLCVWEPTDSDELRWVPRDGLLALMDMIAIHLFKEAWWCETGEWLGPEVLHPPADKEAA